MDSYSQSGLSNTVLKPKPTAKGHVERYITVAIPSSMGYSPASGRVTIDEAKALRRELLEAIRAAGE